MSKKQRDPGAGHNMCLYFSPFIFPFHFWLASSPFIPSRGESQRDKVTSGPAREKTEARDLSFFLSFDIYPANIDRNLES